MNSNRTAIVVTGGAGRLASALRDYFPLAEYPTHTELDVASPGSCRHYFGHRQVDCIIHCAAETAHDAPPEGYLLHNVLGTAHIAQWAGRLGARLVYCSTDYVYPGTTGGYVETDPVAPIGAYATSKMAGELAARLLPNHLVVRGSWYADLGWTSAATDAYSSRLPVAKAAPLVAALAVSTVTGIVNVGGPRRSLYEIGLEQNPAIIPVNRVSVKAPYPIPKDVSLNCSRMKAVLA